MNQWRDRRFFVSLCYRYGQTIQSYGEASSCRGGVPRSSVQREGAVRKAAGAKLSRISRCYLSAARRSLGGHFRTLSKGECNLKNFVSNFVTSLDNDTRQFSTRMVELFLSTDFWPNRKTDWSSRLRDGGTRIEPRCSSSRGTCYFDHVVPFSWRVAITLDSSIRATFREREFLTMADATIFRAVSLLWIIFRPPPPPKKKKEKRKPYAFELPYGGFRFHVAHEHFFLVVFASFILQYRLFFQRWKALITLQEGGKNLFLWKKFSNREIRFGRNCAKKRATVDLTIASAFARHNMNTVRKI